MTRPDYEALARQLDETGEFKVLRRFTPQSSYGRLADDDEARTGLFVDVETTGMQWGADRIIEFAGVPFAYGARSGQITEVSAPVALLEDPGRPIPPDIVRLTHITDEMVAGRRIEDSTVASLVRQADLVIAHNAKFDRPFLEARFPVFAEKPWACSINDVPWEAHGLGSVKLGWLLMEHAGYYFRAHRAGDDCLAAIHLLATPFADDGSLPMRHLLQSSQRQTVLVRAVGSPFDSKDVLKARGYQWDPGSTNRGKAWQKEIGEDALDAERAWLDGAIYKGRGAPELIKLTASVRYAPPR
ncbi:MAG: 3'-5' exonuclease [Gemmatimonadetes bacterium]|nr:3'-5' exonuclease [Gemmatimonadota bacterium]